MIWTKLKNGLELYFFIDYISINSHDISKLLRKIVFVDVNQKRIKVDTIFNTIDKSRIKATINTEIFKNLKNSIVQIEVQFDNDIVNLPVINKMRKEFYLFTDDFIVTVNKQTLGEDGLVSISRSRIENTLAPVINQISVSDASKMILSGDLHQIFSEENIELKAFTLFQGGTNHTIETNEFHFNKVRNQFSLNAETFKDIYEGNWELKAYIELNKEMWICNVITKIKFKEKCNYFLDRRTLYFLKFNSLDGNVHFDVLKDTKDFINSEVYDFSISDNSCNISGLLAFKRFEKNVFLKSLVLKHRQTEDEKEVEIQYDTRTQLFKTSFNISKKHNLNLDGVWDLYVRFTFNELILEERLNCGSESEDIIKLPNTVLAESGIQRVRPYSTLDKNAAIVVRDAVLSCGIESINYQDDGLMIKASLNVPDTAVELTSVFLHDPVEQDNYILETSVKYKEGTCFFESNIKDLPSFYSMKELELYVQFNVGDLSYNYPVVSNIDDISNKSQVYIYPAFKEVSEIDGVTFLWTPFYNQKNELKLRVEPFIKANLLAVHPKRKETLLKVNLKTKESNINDIKLKLVDKDKEFVELINGVETNDSYEFILSKNTLESRKASRWNIYLQGKLKNKVFNIDITCEDTRVINRWSTFLASSFQLDKYIFGSILIEKSNGIVHYEQRELRAIEKRKSRIQKRVAKVVAKLIKPFINKPTWLIGEN